MRLSLGLIIFGTLGIIIASYVGMDIVHKYETPELEDRMSECYYGTTEGEEVSTEDRQNCVYDLYAIYRYAAFFKDICIVLVLSGIFIEVRDIKKTLRGPDQREKDK